MFVRGGEVEPGSYLNSAGIDGGYWSSVGRSSFDAYLLHFNSGDVNPSSNDYRYGGYSVRCVALGG